MPANQIREQVRGQKIFEPGSRLLDRYHSPNGKQRSSNSGRRNSPEGISQLRVLSREENKSVKETGSQGDFKYSFTFPLNLNTTGNNDQKRFP